MIALAISIFRDGEPYKSILQNIASHLKEMKKIRNKISHHSNKSQEVFDTLVHSQLSASNVGIDVSGFLISKKRNSLPFIEIYFTYIRNAAEKIANYESFI